MKKVALLTFGEALEAAKKNTEKPYLIRMTDIKGNTQIKIGKIRHFKIIPAKTLFNTPTIQYWHENKESKSGFMGSSPADISAPDILAEDYIDVNEWDIVEEY